MYFGLEVLPQCLTVFCWWRKFNFLFLEESPLLYMHAGTKVKQQANELSYTLP